LSSIDAGAIASLHTRVGEENGEYSANRVLAMLSKLFAFAKMPLSRIGYRGDNPCKGIQKYPEQKRERYMDADEIGRFLAALQQEDQQTQDFFMAMLLTGARRGNVMSMRWDELELGKATWRIPAEKFKTNKAQTVHLATDVVAILERRQAGSKSEWVFPSVRHGKDGKIGHIEAPKFAWSRICKRAGLNNLRMHDLRRTLGSWQAATGASLPVIGKTLGHQNQATTAIYARLNIDPVRAAVDTAVGAMMGAANGKKDTAEKL
jgi:integrase